MPSRREFLWGMAAAGAAVSLPALRGEPSGAPGSGEAAGATAAAPGRLVTRIDCTRELPPDLYFAHGPTRVVESTAGRYREAEGRHSARFGYRFSIERTGQPHVAVIRYPDDKRRYMCIMDGTSYDLSTGVFTGWARPLSGRMLELRQVFWPRWQDCSVAFLTWGAGEPAAAASIEVYELESLPPLAAPASFGGGAGREIGVQYEDPCGTGASEGATSRAEWVDRVVAYLRHTGQNLLIYPVVWYHGPQFPSAREPADGFDMVVGRDRKQYSRWTTHPADWYASLLERFDREGLGFQGSLTLLRLGSLMQRMNIDLEAIQGGADTFNNLLWNNQVQSSPNDWTTTYNARNYTRLLDYYARKASLADFPWAYGERGGSFPPGPMFNPVHPTVQEAIVGLVREIGERYGRFPAFKGISVNVWHATILWFASLRSGYDDFTVGLFEKETGVRTGVPAKARDRFARRHEVLTQTCRPAWVAWRCAKVHALVRRLRDTLAAARPDLRLTLTLWDETTVPQLLGWGSAATQLYARPSTAQLYREGGLDLALYEGEPGVEVDLGLGNSRDRGGHPHHSTDGLNAPVEAQCMYRDHDFLDAETLGAMAVQRRPGAFIFNCWVESWGEHTWFPCAPDDPQAKDLAVMDGQPAEGIFRLNSIYPSDGFWWDSQLRITPAFQGGVHFLEPYAHALAEFDALRITRGGLFLDKAHTGEIRRFAAAFRALPREKFEPVGASTDPVVVRARVSRGRRCFYLINRDDYTVRVELAFDRPPGRVTDLATGLPVRAARRWTCELGPYELRVFAMDAGVRIHGFEAHPPAEIQEAVLAAARRAVGHLEAARAAGAVIPGLDEFERRIETAMVSRRFAWLRRALTGYIVRKARESVGRAKEGLP